MSFFVYIDRTDDGRPFYVGKGRKARVRLRDRNERWKRIADKHGWQRRVFAAFDEEADAFLIERALILRHGTFEAGPGGVWGANFTSGGEGVSLPGERNPNYGKPVSPERKAKQAAAVAKLSPAEAEAIRASSDSHRVLARRYGVTHGTIYRIKHRRTYNHSYPTERT